MTRIVFTPRLELAFALRWVRDRLTERPLGKDEREKLLKEKGRIECELGALNPDPEAACGGSGRQSRMDHRGSTRQHPAA